MELVLIHLFREGNGPVARSVSVLMGMRAGSPALYFDKLSGRKREEYFAAVRAGLARNSDGGTIYLGDREDFTDSREVMRREVLVPQRRSDGVSITPSMPVDV